MKVRFFKPFDEISGSEEAELRLEKPLSLSHVLGMLGERFPSFRPYLKKEGDEVLSFFVVLVRGDEILKLNDLVRDQDLIKVLPPISGG